MKLVITRIENFGPVFSNVNKYFDVLGNITYMLKRASINSSRTCKGKISQLDRHTKLEKMLRKNFFKVMIITVMNDCHLYYLLIKTMIIQMIDWVLILAHRFGGNNSCRMIAKGGA